MKQLLSSLLLLCVSLSPVALHAQGIVELKFDGKTYKLTNCSAKLAENQDRLYGLTISANDDSNSVVRFYLVDKMSAMPKVDRTDPRMAVGVEYKPKAGLHEASTDIRFPNTAKAYGSSPKYGAACLVNLATLSEKFKMVSGTFEGTIVPIVNGTAQGDAVPVSGRFTDVPLK